MPYESALYDTNVEPSVLAPEVTIKFVHAKLGTIAAINIATLSISFFIVLNSIYYISFKVFSFDLQI